MKESMMIAGIRIPDGGDGEIIEIEIAPIIAAKKKVTLFDVQKKLLSGQDMQTAMQSSLGNRQYRNVIYKSKEWCIEHKLTLFQNIAFELLPHVEENKNQDH